jgi:hypothetical protein
MIEARDVTIKEANDKIRHLENLKKAKEDERDLTFEKTQPKASNITGERVQGGTTREDKFVNYMIECEDPKYLDLCKEITVIDGLIEIWSQYVENELKLIGQYEPLKAKIIELRQTTTMNWDKIAEATLYSVPQCKRIYKSYIQKRYLDQDDTQMIR